MALLAAVCSGQAQNGEEYYVCLLYTSDAADE